MEIYLSVVYITTPNLTWTHLDVLELPNRNFPTSRRIQWQAQSSACGMNTTMQENKQQTWKIERWKKVKQQKAKKRLHNAKNISCIHCNMIKCLTIFRNFRRRFPGRRVQTRTTIFSGQPSLHYTDHQKRAVLNSFKSHVIQRLLKTLYS